VSVCPSCGHECQPGARFCAACGAALVAAAPGALLAAERKVVTVLFCDLVGSTARADGADPEDVQAALAAYHGLVRAELERHGGTVEKFIGDAVMAVFGAPVAHDDDAERAVRAGLSVLSAIDRASAASAGPGLAVRIGVATGEVLVNLGARPERGESLVAGDVVNIAARLQASAEPGMVVVGERTHQLTHARMVYAPLAPVSVKGKAAVVQRWQARGARGHPGAEAGVRSATRFAGRRAELAALRASFKRAVAGPAVELVTVTGEPGVGKSRLVAELFTWADQQTSLVRWRQGRCLPYGDRVTFHALGEIVKAEAGILDSDGEQATRDKLARAVASLGALEEADRAWVTARLGPLAGLAGEPGTGQADRFTAWRRFLEALAGEGPLVLVVEDAQWADAELLAFLGHLVEWAEGVPLLLVVTARPEFTSKAPEFGAEARTVTPLALSPLDDADTAALLAGLLNATLVDAGLQARLLERVGGNPLFAEQVVRLLTEEGRLRRRGRVVELTIPGELPVPDSLSALITARLDTLPRQDKALLGDAAVLGRIFWSGAVAALAGRDEEEVRRSLRALARAGFVARLPRSGMTGQAEYRFAHALVRDAAYAGLPRAVRGARHLAAADWLEAQTGDRGADTAEVVAHHALTAFGLAQARGDNSAVDSLRGPTARRLAAAGDRAWALGEAAAERHYAQAAGLLAPGDPGRAGVLCKWGQASWVTGKPEQAQAALEETLVLARAGDDAKNAGVAMLWLAVLADDRGDEAEAERLTASALALLERLPPDDDLLLAYYSAAYHYARAGRPAEALVLCHRALAPAGSQWKAATFDVRAWARAMLGDPAGAEDAREAIRLARAHSPVYLAAVLANAAERFWLMDGPEAALAALWESREIALRQGNQGYLVRSAAFLAPMFDLGRWDEVLATASEWRPRLDAGPGRGHLAAMEPPCAAVLCWRGAMAEAHQYLDPVLPLARKMALQDLLPALAAAVTLSVADENTPQALSLIEEYEQALSRAPASWYWGGQHLAGIVRACAALGQLEHAQRLAGAAGPTLWRHRLEMQSAQAAIAEAAGDPAADQLYADAADGWHLYGHVLEHGLALLGLGRCRQRAGHPDASAPLLAARAVFADLGAVMPLAEADRRLGDLMRHTS
jgi:class 3 adenylate cyclase/tetratricopeptide (TPR) repeat protein